MPYEFSAQNHDWDLTLYAARELISMGLTMDELPRTGTLSKGFSYFTGGMVMAFNAIESFSASVAFSMQADTRFSSFDFAEYRRKRAFWDKMEMLMSAVGIEIDKSSGIFRDVSDMQHWRNLVTHASPFEISPVEIRDTVKSPGKVYRKKAHLDYTRMANAEQARKFYDTAVAFIDLLKERSGLEPRATTTYRPLATRNSD